MVGHWRGRYAFAITDWARFRATPMPLADRMRVLAMHLVARCIGSFAMRTSVTASRIDEGYVEHTTAASKWAMPLFSSRETLRLGPEGRSLTMRGPQRLWPLFWPPRDFGEATGEIDDEAAGALYRIPWLGGEMVQRTRVVAGGLELSQEAPWFRASVLLRRVSPSA